MVYRKKPKPSKEMVEEMFSKLSPEVLFAGTLGGIAAFGGVTPPLTRMLIALSGSDLPASDLKAHFDKISGNAWWNTAQLGSPVAFLTTFLMGGSTSYSGDKNPVPIEHYAVVASGIMEGMMVMAFMQNPEAQKIVLGGVQAVAKALPL